MQSPTFPDVSPELSNSFVDHFNYASPYWTALNTAAIAGELGGVRKPTTAATINTEAAIYATAKTIGVATANPVKVSFGVKFTDANGTDGAVFVGISDQLGAALIADGGLTIKAGAHTAFGLFKAKGDSVWSAVSAVNGTRKVTKLEEGNLESLSAVSVTPSGTAFQKVCISITPGGYGATGAGTGVRVSYSVGNKVVCIHDIADLTGAAITGLVAFVKAGGAHAQVLSVDWAGFGQNIAG